MFKQSFGTASTKQLRKTKANQTTENPSMTRRKIMLTDLCPEQKAKIGDLVKTLELRKKQNRNLQEQLQMMEENEKKYIMKLEEMERIVREYEKKEVGYQEQLALAKMKEGERQSYIGHLVAEKEELLKKGRDREKKISTFSMTEQIQTQTQSSQTKKKKPKQKSTQTEDPRYQKYSKPTNHNSKSFQKIMKGPYRQTSQKKAQKKQKNPTIKISQEQNPDNSQQELNTFQVEQQQQFDQLAKKWMELKQKNMSKIKQNYEKSKERINSANNEREKRKRDFEYIANKFNDEQEEEEVYNQSFGPHKNKKPNLTQMEQQFDEIELNRILKSKNFSASRIINKNRLTSQQSEKKEKTSEDKRKQSNQLKSSSVSNSRSYNHNNIDFYETDLLDIVNSINN